MPHVSYFWDEMEDNVVEEYDGDTGDTIASYTTEPTRYGSVLSQDRGGEKRYFQFDAIGNTTELTAPDGEVTDMRRHSAFGTEQQSAGNTSNSLWWQGHHGYFSDSAGVGIRQRRFAAQTDRWQSVDPLGLLAISHAAYVYANNSPLEVFDPSGKLSQKRVKQQAPWTTQFDDWLPVPKGVLPNGCGSYYCKWQWILDNGEDDGYIIQKVYFEGRPAVCKKGDNISNITPCDFKVNLPKEILNTKTCPMTSPYFEVWSVKNRNIFTLTDIQLGKFENPKDVKDGGFDIFLFPGLDEHSRGTIKQVGEAIFVPLLKMSDKLKLNDRQTITVMDWLTGDFSSGSRGGGVKPAGILTSKCGVKADEAIWKLLRQAFPPMTKKTATSEFTCCPGVPDRNDIECQPK